MRNAQLIEYQVIFFIEGFVHLFACETIRLSSCACNASSVIRRNCWKFMPRTRSFLSCLFLEIHVVIACVISFYVDFLELIYDLLDGTASVTAISHIAHTQKNWEHGRLFSLQEQTDHKVST